MTPPRVTAILTSCDDARFVRTAVDAILAQRGLPPGAVELIAVDDGSTDGTREILASYGDALSLRCQAPSRERHGPTAAMYAALEHARGEVVALCDADDEWLPDRLARQLALLDARPEVGLVYGDLHVVDEGGTTIHPSNFGWTRRLPVTGRALGAFLARNVAATSSIAIRTELLRALPRAPDWAWCRDWWLAAHAAAAGEVDCVPGAPVTRYRVVQDGVSALGADSAKTLRLWQRDTDVRRILLRTLDLSSVALDDLDAARAHLLHVAGQVATARAQPLTSVLAVDDDDRAEAREQLARAAAHLDGDDPETAARAAAAAWAADPFSAAADQLLARARAAAVGGGGPTPRRAAPSAAQADRVADLRAARGRVLDPTAPLATVLDELNAFRAQLAALEHSGAGRAELLGPTPHDRERAYAHKARALAGPADPATAVRELAATLALDPADVHAQLRLEDAIRALTAQPPRTPDRAGRARWDRPTPPGLEDHRAFVTLAFADELVADPQLLAAYARAIGPDDDATLAILALGHDPATLEPALTRALEQAGLEPDDARDLTAIVAPRTDELEAAVARTAHAVLTRSARAPRCFGGLPATDDPTALREHAERRWTHDGLHRPLSVALRIAAPRWDGAELWGDLHLARALADDLRRRGHQALVQVAEEWEDTDGRACDVAIHLRGLHPAVPHPGQINVLWVMSHPELVTTAECDAHDLVLVASPTFRPPTTTPTHTLEQATDPTVFFPPDTPDPGHAHDVLFVGNSRGAERPIVRDALAAGLHPVIHGSGWEPFVDPALVASPYLANDELRRAYASARLTLNDHHADMREQGFVSNRVYDVLACGGALISDDVPGLTDRFPRALLTYRTPRELGILARHHLADPQARDALAARGRELVLEHHTIAARVTTLLRLVARHGERLNPAAPAPIAVP